MNIKQALVIPIQFTLFVLAKILYSLMEIIWDRFDAIVIFKGKLRDWSEK